jgi:hypothetical protein
MAERIHEDRFDAREIIEALKAAGHDVQIGDDVYVDYVEKYGRLRIWLGDGRDYHHDETLPRLVVRRAPRGADG